GLRPVVAIYSTFLQRALDQLIHDIVLPGLPVTLGIDRAGLVGADGATHQGAYDLAFLRALPGLRLLVPVVGEDVEPMLVTALSGPGPAALRFPRGTLPDGPIQLPPSRAPVEGARWLLQPSSPRACVITLGPLALPAVEAARALEGVAVLDARVLAPLDTDAVDRACDIGRVVTVEEGTVRGGLGSAVLERAAHTGRKLRARLLGLPDAFVRHGDARAQRTALGLDAAGIGRALADLLGR
ncbi:MAG TPA: transketolase C-terminal domain-containing protein, partial [Myxococcaceae bacterium]|nr:transketolase C-terminal domain-containing protein [Myxococcaceae bacterium]